VNRSTLVVIDVIKPRRTAHFFRAGERREDGKEEPPVGGVAGGDGVAVRPGRGPKARVVDSLAPLELVEGPYDVVAGPVGPVGGRSGAARFDGGREPTLNAAPGTSLAGEVAESPNSISPRYVLGSTESNGSMCASIRE